MGKVKRYFTTNDESKDSSNDKNQPKVKTYKVYMKPRKFNPQKARKTKPDKKSKKINNPNPKFKGRAPIPKETLDRHSRGDGLEVGKVKTFTHQKKLQRKEKDIQFSTEEAARTEILLTEEAGFLSADAGETTRQFTQKQIKENVDIASAAKQFELHLHDFGPYRMRYTRNGRHLLLGGKLGHVAAFDWVTKKLHCEINVMETVHDVCWFHTETMFAAAQKDWVYVYDNQGIELHCVKQLNKVLRMEFLPYHFLLATANEMGYLGWLDVSIGQIVAQYNTKLGRLSMMTQNPYNAVLCLGHAKGVVSMWAPNTKEPLAKMLCHKAAMSALHVDHKGIYMATAAIDNTFKIWDVRQLKGPLKTYKVNSAISNLAFSQKGLLAVGMGNVVEIYRDCCTQQTRKSYLMHKFDSTIGNMAFCPFEDVLGVATRWGFGSLLVPGSGEANFDALEINPYETKTQRKEREVKALLEKIQPELITLEPTVIAEVDVPTLKDKIDAKKQLLYVKPPTVDLKSRKPRGKNSTAKVFRNKKIVKEVAKKEFIRNIKNQVKNTKQAADVTEKKHVLDRFVSQKK